jgi:adenosylhomocysteine nucleosidase
MKTIGLIAAMPSESQALLGKVQGARLIKSGSFKSARFIIGNQECILVTSGMGMRRAEEATRWLLQELHPASLISFGIAGAVRADIRIGDVILATRNSILENNRLTESMPLSELSTETWKVVCKDLETEHIQAFHGIAITTRGSQISECPPDWENPILEMETAGILKAAKASQTPLISLRSISDGPNDPIPLDLGEAMDGNGNLRMGVLFRMVLKHPEILLKAGPMMKNSRIAADHAARAVLALLQQEIYPADG